MRKPFSKELHEKYDTLARAMTLEIFSKIPNFTVEESKKKTDVDFRILKDGEHVGYLEVEVKRVWKGNNFGYSDVQFPERKKKYCNLDKPTIFMMYNEDATHYLNVTSSTMLSSPLEMVRNKYIRYGENFFKVNLEKVVFDNIEQVLYSVDEFNTNPKET